MIQDNIQYVTERIEKVCKQKQIKEEVCLIAVSKTKPVEQLMDVYHAGVRDFGENKVQELVDKYPQMPKDVRWHLIGHLQRNKVKYIIDKVYMIHSVDSLRLAEEISKEAIKKQLTVKILIEVNAAKEESKYGVLPEELLNLVIAVSTLPNIQIQGLMTVAPNVENSEQNRQYFALLRQLSVDIMRQNIDNVIMDILSMGMTGDYVTAIEEGSNCVRVGTGIFGERNIHVTD